MSQPDQSLRAVPHEITPSAQCPTFLRALTQILPDEPDRLLLQEIFGYCLLPDCRFQKMACLVGEGANGKSVVLLVLREMLGHQNVGSVSLDAIDPSRSFLLATLNGMLANIVEDMNEVKMVAEGTLKQLVAGEPVLIERKYKDPVPARLTAKWVMSTNTLPRLSDKTEGMYRRLIVLPFLQSFSDPSVQRKDFANPEFWRQSGELPGVLVWALQGLARLLQQGRFTESANAAVALKRYRLEGSPARLFCIDHVAEKTGAELASCVLYESYVSWCKENGCQPLAATTFTKEVHRQFPNASISEHARNFRTAFGIKRTRFWSGLALLNEPAQFAARDPSQKHLHAVAQEKMFP